MLSNSSPAPRGTDTGNTTGTLEMAGLGNRFLSLLGRKWSRRAFAVEMAKLVAQATRAKATVILGYQRRGGTLVLLADNGLPEEARAALAGGTQGAWDIPLRGLQNRRISVIEAAHQNPFVPRALTKSWPGGLCIVSLPVYYDYEPVGVVLLFAARARAFPDTQLQTLSQALRVCGRGLRERELPGPRAAVPAGEMPAPSADAASEPAPEAADSVSQASKRAAPALHLVEAQPSEQPAGAPLSEAQRVEQDLARAQAEMQRRNEAVRSLTTAMRALRTERDRLAQQLTELQYLRTTETTDLRTQMGQIEERLLAAESERVRYQRSAEAKRVRAEEAVKALEAERDGLLDRLRSLEANDRDTRELLAAARAEHDVLASRNTALASDLQLSREELEQAGAVHDRARTDLESERDQWHTRADASEARLSEQTEAIVVLRQDLDRAVQAREFVAAELARARAEAEQVATATAELRARLTQAEVEGAAAGAENARLREALDETQSGLVARIDELQAALRERQSELERSATQHQKSAAAQEDLARQLTASRAQLEERAATLAAAQEQLAAQERTLAQREEQRIALQAQFESSVSKRVHAEQALESARADTAALTQTTLALRAQITEEQALLARLRHEREEAGHAESTWQDTAVSLRSDVTQLTSQLEQARTQHQQAIEAAEDERARLQAKLQQLTHDAQDRESQRAAAVADAAAQREALTQVQAAFLEANSERQQLSTQMRQLTADLKASRREIDQLAKQAAERESQLEAAAAQGRQLQEVILQAEARAAGATAQSEELRQTVRDAVERLEKERLGRAAEIESLLAESTIPITEPMVGTSPAGTDTDTPEPMPAEEIEPSREEPLVIERSAPLATAAAEAVEVSEPAEPEPVTQPAAASIGELVLLDQGTTGDQARAALEAAGFEVSAMAPGDATVDELARRKLKCIMLNLAAGPVAWNTLKLLRERLATRNVPVLAYVMAPNAQMGFCFGRTDFALWPLEPGRLIERLGRLRPKLQRLLAITADVDGMGRLRESLTRAKISTSIVLDAKQVLDFATMVDPEAALLHLSPSCPSSARAILTMRANSATRDLPMLVLLDKPATADEEAFLSQASQLLLGKPGFRFSRLPEEIGRLIG